MRRACRLAIAAQGRPGCRLALRDLHSAFSVGGDDGFVFAYRVLEDLARAISGARGQLDSHHWAALHSHLRTTRTAFMTRIAPLQEARRAAAHGDETDPRLIAARSDRGNRLAIAREVLGEALAREPGLPFEIGYMR
jgi:hypothetical protein